MRAAFAAFAAVAVVAGCSGGDGGDGRLSKKEYVERADAICAEYERRLDELPKPASIRDLGDVAARALPLARRGVRELKALRPPGEIRADVRRWLERNDRNLMLLEALRDAARAGKTTRVQEIASEAADNEAVADRLARRIGLQACAESGS